MSEWENLAAEAQRYDRAWLKEQLDQRNVTTLRLYVATAGISLGRNPRKDSCISALLDQVFPVAPRFSVKLHI